MEMPAATVLVNERATVLMERGFAAEAAINPATGAEYAWIPDVQAAAALEAGLTTWDAPGFVALALSSLLRRKAADFVGIDETRAMLAQVEPVFPQLVAETVPRTVSLFVLTDVLRRLVAEGVSIRDLRAILMALADWGRVERDPLMLTEYARVALRRQLTHRFSHGTNQLVVVLLHPDIERSIRDSTRHTATGSYVDLEPSRLRGILEAIREPIASLPNDVQVPQLLTAVEIRSSVRRLVAPSMPHLHVVSYQELRPDADVQPIGRISLDGFSPRSGVSVNGAPLWPEPQAS
jgi:type III secretion protein V